MWGKINNNNKLLTSLKSNSDIYLVLFIANKYQSISHLLKIKIIDYKLIY